MGELIDLQDRINKNKVEESVEFSIKTEEKNIPVTKEQMFEIIDEIKKYKARNSIDKLTSLLIKNKAISIQGPDSDKRLDEIESSFEITEE